MTEGAEVADVGCGPGAVSIALAEAVGPRGTVYAVDRDPQALGIAEQLAQEAGVANVRISEGSATASGLAQESVDVVMMRHVLAHNGGAEQQIVDHLATLARPGGAVYLVDVELTGMRMRSSTPVPEMAELSAAYAEFHAQRGNDLSVGLRLGELLERAGLEHIDHSGIYQILQPPPDFRPPAFAARGQMLASGVINQDDVARWERAWSRFSTGELTATVFVPLFFGVGRKPR